MNRNVQYSFFIAAVFILLWIYAAGSKLMQYDVFIAQLSRQPLPSWSIRYLAWGLPSVELLTAFLLCFQRTIFYGLLLSFVLMLCFTVYVALALRGAFGDIPCSCGGIFSFMRWKAHLVFNILFTVMAFIGYVFSKRLRRMNYEL